MALALTSAVVACGPEFPNSYYGLTEHGLLRAPEGSFAAEIARIAAGVPAPVKASADTRTTAEVELDELRDALAGARLPRQRVEEVEAAYARFRAGLDALKASKEAVRSAKSRWEPIPQREKDPEMPALPASLPAEFALYLRGAWAWHTEDLPVAITVWEELLQLPASKRQKRSVWAAFMLGRARLLQAENRYDNALATEAAQYFQQTRELAKQGLSDPLGLAASSIGWEARAKLRTRDFKRAIDLYLQQHAAGDSSALVSLGLAAERAARARPEELKPLALDPTTRRVVTAYHISRFDARWAVSNSQPAELERWTRVLRDAGVPGVPDTDRLAWLAYSAGMFPLAWEWVALAPADSAEAIWLRAKLTLRGGDLKAGEQLLRTALNTQRLSQPHHALAGAELARTCLARDDFSGALEASLLGGHWMDAAFVAERVMTAAELREFVDGPEFAAVKTRLTTAGPSPDEARWSWWRSKDLPRALEHLLARRLARLGKDEAAAYFSEDLQTHYDEYLAGVRLGFDGSRAASARARGFWTAAQIARLHGMELLGTELEPDWAMMSGNYNSQRSVDIRRAKDEAAPTSVFRPTPLELARLEKHPAPEKRFHYRYRAAELAWWAASLLPNDSDETAQILAIAGGWLKDRDAEAAKPFYQALVIRCSGTELGRAAEQARWFPSPAAGAKPEL